MCGKHDAAPNFSAEVAQNSMSNCIPAALQGVQESSLTPSYTYNSLGCIADNPRGLQKQHVYIALTASASMTQHETCKNDIALDMALHRPAVEGL